MEATIETKRYEPFINAANRIMDKLHALKQVGPFTLRPLEGGLDPLFRRSDPIYTHGHFATPELSTDLHSDVVLVSAVAARHRVNSPHLTWKNLMEHAPLLPNSSDVNRFSWQHVLQFAEIKASSRIVTLPESLLPENNDRNVHEPFIENMMAVSHRARMCFSHNFTYQSQC